jgi:hypothetical protein
VCGWNQSGGRDGGKRVRRMNMVQTMYVHVCKCKKDTCFNCSRNQGRGNRVDKWKGEFKYDVFDTL